jgi:hypothetical protein
LAELGNISFPSSVTVTYQKMKETVLKFRELGGAPFTQQQIMDKMKDLGNVGEVSKRVVPFLKYLGFLTRSRIGLGGEFTHKLVPEIRERLDKNIEQYDSELVKLCKLSPAYLVIWKYADEERTNKFPVTTFEQQYLDSKLRLKYSKTGFNSWLNTLEKVKLIGLKDGFISLEGIASPLELPQKTHDAGQSRNESGGGRQTSSDEGIAPSMNINIDLRLDYRQTPDLQREYMTWLDKMSSKPTVRMSIKRTEEGKEPTTEKKTDQN